MVMKVSLSSGNEFYKLDPKNKDFWPPLLYTIDTKYKHGWWHWWDNSRQLQWSSWVMKNSKISRSEKTVGKGKTHLYAFVKIFHEIFPIIQIIVVEKLDIFNVCSFLFFHRRFSTSVGFSRLSIRSFRRYRFFDNVKVWSIMIFVVSDVIIVDETFRRSTTSFVLNDYFWDESKKSFCQLILVIFLNQWFVKIQVFLISKKRFNKRLPSDGTFLTSNVDSFVGQCPSNDEDLNNHHFIVIINDI